MDYFHASKILWALATPLNAALLFLACGLMLLPFRDTAGRVFLYASLAVMLTFGVLPTGKALTANIENTYQRPDPMPQKVDGIILLGGAVDPDLSAARGSLQLNDHAERLLEFLDLAHKYPNAKLVVTGGSASLNGKGRKEADILKEILPGFGLEGARVIYEDNSRNTNENAEFSKKLVHPQKGQTWLLVTSAFHMKRSVAIFEGEGWAVTPVPVDYLTDGKTDWVPHNFDILGNMHLSNVALHEMAGLAVYKIASQPGKP